jgi:hypothetical protein
LINQGNPKKEEEDPKKPKIMTEKEIQLLGFEKETYEDTDGDHHYYYYEITNGMSFISLEKYGVDLARRKRLWEDFNKIENDLLSEMEKGFLREFIMTPQEYEDHTSTFDGTTEEFYMYCLKTFDKSGKSQERRGRPLKNQKL